MSVFRCLNYELTDEGLLVKHKNFKSQGEQLIEYDQIGHKASAYFDHSTGSLFCGVVFTILAIATLIGCLQGANVEAVAPFIWGTIAVILWVNYFRSRARGVRFVSAIGTVVIAGAPSKTQSIVEQLPLKKLGCIDARAGRRLAVLGKDAAASYLLSLRESAVLKDDDYLSLLEKHGLIKPEERSVGFPV